MSAWFRRNTVPIAIVVLASVAVIVAFELIDALAAAPLETDGAAGVAAGAAPAEDELSGVASLAGLIKVSAFLGVGALIARAVRRAVDGGSPSGSSPTPTEA